MAPSSLDAAKYLAFIEFLASFLGSSPVLTGRHMALQRAVPRKTFMAVRTFVWFFTYGFRTEKASNVNAMLRNSKIIDNPFLPHRYAFVDAP